MYSPRIKLNDEYFFSTYEYNNYDDEIMDTNYFKKHKVCCENNSPIRLTEFKQKCNQQIDIELNKQKI